MDNSQEITALLTEIRDHLREGARRQAETLEFLRGQTEQAKERVEHAISIQQLAVKRQRAVQLLVLPVLALVIGVLIYLLVFKL